jgi:hypothetical protein
VKREREQRHLKRTKANTYGYKPKKNIFIKLIRLFKAYKYHNLNIVILLCITGLRYYKNITVGPDFKKKNKSYSLTVYLFLEIFKVSTCTSLNIYAIKTLPDHSLLTMYFCKKFTI